ncbi:type II secretion system GspH family protein [Halorhodospira halochloris]|uniref:type IV pilus modification PilV family protein n=1 Tax=Halorhodospira halochloris TaxID=1052 RepID=UPI001EE78E5C|nr:type II secretion system protein [Halorhodospira halochloris]MCG5531177.1 type II secretion system GspH family protein [Halorhodospira halochloris]
MSTARSRSIAPRSRGFSLVESLVALGLLASVAVALSQQISASIAQAHQSALHHRAVLAAEEITSLAMLLNAQGDSAAVNTSGWQGGDCTQHEALSSQPTISTSAWLNELSCSLPGSQAKVTSSTQQLTVRVRWRRDANAEHREIALGQAL